MEGAATTNLDEPPATPVVFRAPRRRVLHRLVYAVAAGVLAGVGWSALHVVWLATVATIACLIQLAATARAATGTVTVEPEGVRLRTLSATRRYSWTQITGCAVRAGIVGRTVRLTRAVPHRRLRLPAPASPYLIPDPHFDTEVRTLRDLLAGHGATDTGTEGTASPRRYWFGLAAILAAALLLDQPWGWPAGPSAVAVPEPCAAAAGHLAAMVGERTGEHRTVRPDSSTVVEWCQWDLGGSPERFVRVEIQRYDRLGLHSGTWRAKTNFSTARRALAGEAVDSAPRLGDESVLVESDVAAGIVGRRGNVLAWIAARGPVPGYNRADLLALERNLLDGVRLR